MSFKDYFSQKAPDYARFRPHYPAELFAFIASCCKNRLLAWDCATGNGQAALGLTAHFERVIASDASAEQIEHAFKHERISYRVAPAESSGIDSDSLDAVTVAQALHWLDIAAFYKEAKRALKADGVLAAWCYGRSSVDEDIDTIVQDLQDNVLRHYWAPEVVLVEQCYRSVDFPFSEIDPPGFAMHSVWSLPEYMGYLSTWSAVQSAIEQEGEALCEPYFERIERAWGEPERKRRVTTKLFLRMGRNKRAPIEKAGQTS